MILTFAEDFSTTTDLDSELIGTSPSDLYWNRGVHPVLTVDNLVNLLPIAQLTFADYNSETSYSAFETSKAKSDIVTSDGVIYQSLQDENVGNAVTDSYYWLATNLDSLRLKSFIWTVEANAKAALSIDRKLIENQYIYNVGEDYVSLSGYQGWAIEPKGSDYVTIRINQMAIQAEGTDDVEISVINQGEVIDTITLKSNDGKLVFERTDYTFKGKGTFYFVFNGDDMRIKGAVYNDALKYSGFVAYPVNGSTIDDLNQSPLGNGLNFNVTAYLDASTYIENNELDFAKMYQAQMEMNFIEMLTVNANARDNRVKDILSNEAIGLLATEKLEGGLNTVSRKYLGILRDYKAIINKTFDNFLKSKPKFKVSRKTV